MDESKIYNEIFAILENCKNMNEKSKKDLFDIIVKAYHNQWELGYQSGMKEGKMIGYNKGYDDAYNKGYDDAYDDCKTAF